MTVKVKVGQTKNVRLVATGEKRPVIVPDSITLGIDTVGDYVAKIDAGQGIVVTPETDIESANLVISHANTTTEVSTNNSVLEFIRNASIDQFGHITNLISTGLNSNNFISSNNEISTKDITFGNTSITLGESTDELRDLRIVDIGEFTISGNTISAPASINFNLTDSDAIVNIGRHRIIEVEDPIDERDVVNRRYLDAQIDGLETTFRVFEDPVLETDATNKRYVDNLVQGLRVRPSALAATTTDLGGTFDAGNTTFASTITLDPVQILYIDDVTAWNVGDNLLVKDQNNPLENGSYDLIQQGDANTAWIFQRTEWSNESSEVPGSYEFVTDGTQNGGTGWVVTVADASTFNLNTDTITWSQFQGEGTYTAGRGLTLTGTQFSVNKVQDIEQISGNGAIIIPVGDSSERPSSQLGMIRFNSEDGQFEGYDGQAWAGLGGVIDVDQDTKILAENSPGSDNDELKFYTGGTLAATFSANTASFTGDVDVVGNVTIGGNITIGDHTSDTVEVVADFTSNLIPDSANQYDLGAGNKQWKDLYVGAIKSEDGIITLSSTIAVELPSGQTSDRPFIPTAGMLRFNTDDGRFEGYDGTQWSGIAGSVIDLDRNTYIIAETSTGADNNELDFYTANTQRMQIDSVGDTKFGSNLDSVIINYSTGNLIVNSKVTADSDLVLDPTGNIDVANNIITGLASPVNPSDAVNLGYLDNQFSSGLTIEDTENANTFTDGINLLSSPTLKLGSGIEAKSVDTANNELEIGLTDTGVTAQVYGNDRYMPRIRVTSDGRIDFATEIPVELQANAIPDFTETTRDIIGLMFTDAMTGGQNQGVELYNDDANNTIYAVADNFDITLTGDVSGTATVSRLTDTSITTSLTADFIANLIPTDANSGIIVTHTPGPNSNASIELDYTYLDTVYVPATGGTYTGDVYAPRFVDSNNTQFYMDPAGTSRINQMEVGYGATFSQLKMRDGPGSFSYFYASSGKIGFLDNTFNYAAYSERSTGNWVVQNGDVQAERFVDVDATSYFVHPGNNSNLKQLTVEDSIAVDQLDIGGDVGSRTIKTTQGALTIDASGGIVLNGNGNDLDINNVKIVNLSDPTADQDAATKSYVDAVAQGLRVIPSALAATTADLSATFSNDTLTISAVATLDIDGVTAWSLGDRLLVKDQTALAENGSYELTQVGGASTDWVFTRGEYFNETSEIPGAFQFVTDGTTNAGTGWVATVTDAETFAINTDSIVWYQFSGAGTYSAGESLTLNGTEFSIADGDIPNVKLANPQINIAGEAGANTVIALGETLTINGTNGVNTTITNNRVDIAVDELDGGTF